MVRIHVPIASAVKRSVLREPDIEVASGTPLPLPLGEVARRKPRRRGLAKNSLSVGTGSVLRATLSVSFADSSPGGRAKLFPDTRALYTREAEQIASFITMTFLFSFSHSWNVGTYGKRSFRELCFRRTAMSAHHSVSVFFRHESKTSAKTIDKRARIGYNTVASSAIH